MIVTVACTKRATTHAAIPYNEKLVVCWRINIALTHSIRQRGIGMTTNIVNALSYRILLREEPEGGYTVTVPTLSGCITYGETIVEAIAMAREAIELYLESLVAHHEEILTEEGTLEYTVMVPVYA